MKLFSKKPIISQLFNLNSAFVIFICTIAAYGIAIIYERAYLSVFGMGIELIQISPVVIFYSIVILILVYLALEVPIQFHHYCIHKDAYFKRRENLLFRYIYRVTDLGTGIMYGILIISAIMDIPSKAGRLGSIFIFAVIIPICALLISILWPLVLHAKTLVITRSFKQTLSVYFEVQDKKHSRSSNRKSRGNILNEKVIGYASFVILTATVPSIYASEVAHNTKNFYVWSTHGEVKDLVVRYYGRDVLIKEYDTKEKKFLDGFIIGNLDEPKSFNEKYNINN